MSCQITTEAQRPAGCTALLDTLGVSVKPSESQDYLAWVLERDEWRELVLLASAGWRESAARRLRSQGAARQLEAEAQLEAESQVGTTCTRPAHSIWWRPVDGPDGRTWVRERVSRWHAARADALLDWGAKLRLCGRESVGLRVACATPGCGHERVYSVGCGVEALCAQCRARSANRWRQRFDAGRQCLEDITRGQALHAAIHGRLLTLTAPDIGSLQERIRVRALAWRKFSKRLSAFFVRESQRYGEALGRDPAAIRALIHYMRVEEWTAGADGLGHPHYHVWLHSPWLERDEWRDYWRRDVLVAAQELGVSGYDAAGEWWQFDIRAAGADVAHELVKYLIKDYVGEPGVIATSDVGRRVVPAVFSELLRVNRGRRRRQCSSGFGAYCEAGRRPPECPCCGYDCEAELVRVDRQAMRSCSGVDGTCVGAECRAGPDPPPPEPSYRQWRLFFD